MDNQLIVILLVFLLLITVLPILLLPQVGKKSSFPQTFLQGVPRLIDLWETFYTFWPCPKIQIRIGEEIKFRVYFAIPPLNSCFWRWRNGRSSNGNLFGPSKDEMHCETSSSSKNSGPWLLWWLSWFVYVWWLYLYLIY